METKTNELKKEWMAAIHDVEQQLLKEAAAYKELFSLYIEQLDNKDCVHNN